MSLYFFNFEQERQRQLYYYYYLRERMMRMGIVQYVFFAYALTAVIAFAVIALIVFVNWMMSRNNQEEEMQ